MTYSKEGNYLEASNMGWFRTLADWHTVTVSAQPYHRQNETCPHLIGFGLPRALNAQLICLESAFLILAAESITT